MAVEGHFCGARLLREKRVLEGLLYGRKGVSRRNCESSQKKGGISESTNSEDHSIHKNMGERKRNRVASCTESRQRSDIWTSSYHPGHAPFDGSPFRKSGRKRWERRDMLK